MMKVNFYDLTFTDLEEVVGLNELSSAMPAKLFNWHYKQARFDTFSGDLKNTTLDFISKNFNFDLPVIDRVVASNDGTVKFLMKLADDRKVETVLLPFQNKYSLCISSQVGCAMSCSFCYTGVQGLSRHLKTHEMVGQFLFARKWLKENRPSSPPILAVVFMGQGEPLHNYEAVKKTCSIFTSSYGLSLGPQKITISTSGYLPGLKKWVEDDIGVNLALSLHSPIDDKRNELIPLNRRYPVADLMQAIDQIKLRRKQFVIYEYLLIDGLNDTIEDIEATSALLKDRPCQISLIPFNPFPGSRYKRPSLEKTEYFRDEMEKRGVVTLIRGTKGDDVLAACGQLNSAAT